jgi:RHH-type transcriptional regulator, rel operon repressor / antitoxin RelB
MHGMTGRQRTKPAARSTKSAAAKGGGARKPVAGVVRIPVILDERLTRLARQTGRSKNFYARKAIERLVDDTEDYMLGVAAAKASRKTFSSDEVRRLVGVDD